MSFGCAGRLPAVPSGSTEMDLVMREDSIPRNLWKLACVAAAHPDEKGYVRKVKLAVADQSLESNGTSKKLSSHLFPTSRAIYGLVLMSRSKEDWRF